MLKALQATSALPVSEPKTKLRSVLGFAASGTPKDVETLSALASNSGHPTQRYTRRSVDSTISYQPKRKDRTQRTSVADGPFFEDDAVTVAPAADIPVDMKNGIAPRSTPSRRLPQREKQEGHWTISVAETPHDATSYSLYIKSACFALRRLHHRVLARHILTKSRPQPRLII